MGVKFPHNEGEISMKGLKEVQECTKFDTCNAPMCPLLKKHLGIACWYADEDTCNMKRAQWLITQKKIAKKAKDNDTYYTFEMLNRNIVVRGGITGLDPDKAEEPQLKKWLTAHPEQTKESLATKAINAKKNLKSKKK